MIGARVHPAGPDTGPSGGWVSAVAISLLGHGVLVGALLLMEGDFTPPVAPRTFTVDVVIETAPSGVEAATAKQVQSPAGKPPATSRQTAAPPPKEFSAHSADPALAILKKMAPAAARPEPVPEPLVKIIYAPIPRSKPVLFPPPVAKEPVAATPAASPTAGESRADTKTSASNQQSLLPDAPPFVTSAIPGSPDEGSTDITKGGASGGSFVPPEPVAHGGGNPLPPYPRAARRRGLEGKLVLRVTVNAQGRPDVVKVLESSGHALLDDAAIRAVARWQFQPGRRGTAPVQASIDLPVVFRLKGDR
jgi:periplasmic protein TonB